MKVAVDLKAFKPAMLATVAGAVLCLLALSFAWDGWQLLAGKRLEARAGEARAQVAAAVDAVVSAAVKELDARRARVAVISAIKSGQMDSARDLLGVGWEGVEAIELHSPDLTEAFTDPEAFGYGKLSVLELAFQSDRVHYALAKDSGGPRFVLAAPIMDDGRLLRLVYVRMPAAPITDAVNGAVPEAGYIAIRQGRHSVAESGDKSLAISAEVGAVVIGDSALRVVAAAPLVAAGLFGMGGYGEFGVGVGLLLAGIALVVLSLRKKAAVAVEVADEQPAEKLGPTLAELQASGKLDSPAPEAAPVRTGVKEAAPRVSLDRSIFRAYDIRGVVGSTLSAEVAKLIGQAVGTLMQERNLRSIVVGRDGRLSSPQMADALIDGLRSTGREVIDIGEAPTPLVYFGTFHLRTGSGIAVTGSHNPPDYNGFKIVVDGETLAGDAIRQLYERIAENRLHRAESPGQLSRRDIADDYINRIAGDIQIERKLRVVVDCGSGVPGMIAPRLLEAIGADVEPLFCEVDGTFPHHHPDPSDPRNLVDLIKVVQRIDADLGIAFDGDGDRLGVVTRDGEMIYPDRLLMLFAADVLERNPGACVIYDVKCTGHLATHILRHGGSPLMWKTGHSLIKAKMKETEAELAGEMSGHFFFRERWYGFDDGLYAAARLLEILAAQGDSPTDVLKALPNSVSTPELKIEVEEGEQYRLIEAFVASAKFEGARIATIDGLRADWPDGWGLVRASNTTPVLVLRFDAKDSASLQRIQALFREQLLASAPGLTLPF